MIKFTKIFVFIFSIIFTSFSYGTLITNLSATELAAANFSNAQDFLTEELEGINYVTYNGWDYAWVSPVNSVTWSGNTLYAPQLQKNWFNATISDLTGNIDHLSIIKTLGVNFFTKTENGESYFIHAVEFWNSQFKSLALTTNEESSLTSLNFAAGDIVGEINQLGARKKHFDLFYVRNVSDRPAPSQVPEPASLLIFALGLIALSLRVRRAN